MQELTTFNMMAVYAPLHVSSSSSSSSNNSRPSALNYHTPSHLHYTNSNTCRGSGHTSSLAHPFCCKKKAWLATWAQTINSRQQAAWH